MARIVGSSYDSPRRLATLSAGSAAGVAPGQPVRSADGLIGRVIETGRWAARVMLVTDGASNVPVRLVRDGTPALAVGRGDGTIELRTLEVGQNPFRRGDILVTSGVGGIFPPNIPVALVTASEGDTAIARPIADPARMDFAIVQRVYQPAADGPLDRRRRRRRRRRRCRRPPTPHPGQQNNPRYQPALQQPQPGMIGGGDAAMSRIAGSETEVAIRDLGGATCRSLSTVAAILLGAMLPMVAASPWVPNLGFLMLHHLAAGAARNLAGAGGAGLRPRRRPDLRRAARPVDAALDARSSSPSICSIPGSACAIIGSTGRRRRRLCSSTASACGTLPS